MRELKDRSGRRGVALVEAVLVIPILLLLTFAIFEYGWMFLKIQEITNATRHGARLAITPDATSEQVRVAVTDLLNQTNDNKAGLSVTLTPAHITTAAAGETVTMEVAIPYGSLQLLEMSFLPVPANLRSRVSMAKESP